MALAKMYRTFVGECCCSHPPEAHGDDEFCMVESACSCGEGNDICTCQAHWEISTKRTAMSQAIPEIIPLRVRTGDGSDGPEPLSPKRTAATREEILTGLTVKERMLVFALVEAIEQFGIPDPDDMQGVRILLRAFQDATGVDYVGSAWDK